MRELIILLLITCTYISSIAQKTELVVPDGHTSQSFDMGADGFIKSYDLSKDGNFFTTAGKDGTAILWEKKKGIQIKKFIFKSPVEQVRFSNDSKQIAVVLTQGYAVMDVLKTRIIFEISEPDYNLQSIAFTKDDLNLILTGSKGMIYFADIKGSGKIIQQIKISESAFIKNLTISPNYQKVALFADNSFGSEKSKILLFDYPESLGEWESEISKASKVETEVSGMSFDTAEKYLITTASDYSKLAVYDAQNLNQLGKYVFNTNHGETVFRSNIYKNKVYLSHRKNIEISEKIKDEYKFIGLQLPDLKITGDVKSAAGFYDPTNNHFLVTNPASRTISTYDENFNATGKNYESKLTNARYIDIHENNMALATESGVLIWDFEKKQIIKKLNFPKSALMGFEQIHGIQFDTSGKSLYVNCGYSIVKYNTVDWSKLWEAKQNFGIFENICVSANNHFVVGTVNTYSGRVLLYDAATGKQVGLANGNDMDDCVISPDGKYVAVSGSQAGYIYSLPDLKEVFKSKNIAYSNHLVFAPDSKTLFSIQENKIQKVSIPDFEEVQFRENPERVTSVVYSEFDGNANLLNYAALDLGRDKIKVYKINASDGSVSNELYFQKFRQLEKFRNQSYYISISNTGVLTLNNTTGELLCEIYFFNNDKDWVVRTPDGRFDGSENGIKMLYYQKGTKTVPLELLYEKYYTPNLLTRLYNGEKFSPIDNIDDLKNKPKARVYYADAKKTNEEERILTYTNTSGTAEITVTATAPEDKVDEIRLFHNGKAVNLATRGLFVENAEGENIKKYTLQLVPGQNNIRAIALNSQRTESEPDEIIVAYNKSGGSAPAPVKPANNNSVVVDEIDKNATLHIVVVGINAYKGKINPLTYALPDATAFKAELEKDAKTFVSNVKSYLVTDDAASKAGIVAAFDNIKKTAKPEDVFVFYYAGHGYIHPTNKEFYLVSSDVADGNESLLKNGVSAKELQTFAVDIPAQKQLFIMDACQSAGAFEQMLKHDGEQQKALAVVSRSTGTHWMAASGSTETAKEFGELGHGVFTYSLLEALKGKATNNKMITVNGLKNYLQIIVPELVKKYGGNSQYPASYGFGNDFPVEIVK